METVIKQQQSLVHNSVNLTAGYNLGPPLKGKRSKVYSHKRGYIDIPVEDIASCKIEDIITAVVAVLARYHEAAERISVGLLRADGSVTSLLLTIDRTYSFDDLRGKVDEALVTTPSCPKTAFEVLAGDIENNSYRSGNPIFHVLIVNEGIAYYQREKDHLRSDVVLLTDKSKNCLFIDYSERLFSVATIERFVKHTINLLAASKYKSPCSIALLNYLAEEERQELHADAAQCLEVKNQYTSVVALFDRQVTLHSQNIAVSDRLTQVNYGELQKKTFDVAINLQKYTIGRRERVGLCLSPSIDTLSCLIGVLRTGATVVPLDYSLPPHRFSQTLALANPDLIISDVEKKEIYDDTTFRWVDVAVILEGSQKKEVEADEPKNKDDAYIVFTSGSTGEPKGVRMHHGGLSNLIQWQIKRIKRKPQGIGLNTLHRTSIAFDVGFQEVFSTLCDGGKLVIATDDERADIGILPDLIQKNNIERLFLPPVALIQLASVYQGESHHLESIGEIIVAGEQLKINRKIMVMCRENSISIDNHYGPSETHVVTAYRLSDNPLSWSELPLIGRPIDGCYTHILDTQGNECPIGVTGEIYIEGCGIGNGYINLPEGKEQAFIHDHSASISKTRLYRTGDFAIRKESGDIHFVGRRDQQLKIKGYRVELAEVEAAVYALPQVGQSAVKVFSSDTEMPYIVIYYCSDTASPKLIRKALLNVLPAYMVPANNYIIPLNAMPLTSTGKIDRQALMPPELTAFSGVKIITESSVEEWLLQCWEKQLKTSDLSATENFIELGGDSLAAINVEMEINERYGCRIPLSKILRGTLKNIADAIERCNQESNTDQENNTDEQQASVSNNRILNWYTLSDGRCIAQYNEPETTHLYKDIFIYKTCDQSFIRYSQGGVIVDVGANIGLFSLYARDRSPDAKIIAIEPSLKLVEALGKNRELISGDFTIIHSAVLNNASTATLTYYPYLTGMSTVYPKEEENRDLFSAIIQQQERLNKTEPIDKQALQDIIEQRFSAVQEEVPARSLSSIFKELSLQKIDLLKIDVQRSEESVLASIEQEDWQKIQQMVIELHDIGSTLQRILELLTANNFKCEVSPHPMHPESVVKMLYASRY